MTTGLSFASGRLVDAITKSDDAFGRRVAQGTRNNLDLASQYTFSPERVRLFRNGSREFPQYGSVSQFTDTADSWDLKPDAGDTMHIESAESGTYVVNYEMVASWALELNQSLSDGDVCRVGPYNDNDGWYLEQRGSDHTDEQADLIERSGGSDTTQASDVSLKRPLTDWTRIECRFNWYGVGNQVWRQTYTNGGEQKNQEIARTSTDGERGPETGNLNLRYEIQADASTTGLELHGGSMGMIVNGDPTSLNRDKPQYEEITVAGTAEAWEPILALRVAPDDSDVNCQFSRLAILDYGANDTIELVVASFDASKTNATGWETPEYHHDMNTALQRTTNISQVANDSGTVEDLDASTKFGGFTLASAVNVDGGNASGSDATSNQNRQEKKAVLNSDHTVFLARTGTMDSEIRFTWDVDQNW